MRNCQGSWVAPLRPFPVILLVLLSALCVNAQESAVIAGTVKNTNGQPLLLASVIIMQPDSTIVAFTSTGNDGGFRIAAGIGADGIVCASMLGYGQSCVTVAEAHNRSNTLDFVLAPQHTVLKEVNVNAWPAIRERGDTVIYRMDSFTNQTERNLEDALAKLPGFRIDESGTISVNGTNITKINIEDDDLIGSDYKLLSKNLTADMVEEVEVVNGYLENPLYKGIVESEEIALNLRLKKDRHRVLFGNADAAAGPNGKYDVTGNGIILANAIKAYVLATGNNVGFEVTPPATTVQGVAAVDRLDPVIRNDGLLDIHTAAPVVINSQRSVLNNGRLGSLNVVGKPDDRLSVRGNLHVYRDDNEMTSESINRYFSEADTTFFNERKGYGNVPFHLLGNVDLTYNPGSKSLVKLTYNNRRVEDDGSAEMVLNDLPVYQQLTGVQREQRVLLDYTQRLGQGSLLHIQSVYIRHALDQHLTVPAYSHLAGQEEFDYPIRQDYQNPVEGAVTQVKWVSKPAVGFTYHVSIDHQYDDEQLQSALLEGMAATAVDAGGFSNQYRQKQHRFSIGLEGRVQIGRRVSLFGKLAVNQHHVVLEDQIHPQAGFNQRLTYLSPNVGMHWSFARRHRLTINYAYEQRPTPLHNLFNGYVFTNYRSAQRYETSFSQLKTQTMGLRYTYRYPFRQFFANMYIYFGTSGNALQSSIQYDPVYFFSTAFPTSKNQPFFGVRLGMDKLLAGVNILASLTSNTTRFSYVNRVNTSTDREVSAVNVSNEVSLNSTFSIPYNMTLRARNAMLFNRAEVGSNVYRNRQSRWILSLQNTLRLTDKWFINQTLEHYRWSYPAIGTQYQTTFFDVGVDWHVIHDKLGIHAKIRNAFDQHQLKRTNITDYSDAQDYFMLQPRVTLIGISYTF